MKTVEFVYDHDCPNVSATRAQLLRAFAETGLPARWTEWAREDPGAPDHVRGYGSPTILVDGKDVVGAAPADGISCCRLYHEDTGKMQGVPSSRMIAAALQTAAKPTQRPMRRGRTKGWHGSLATLPGLGAALLPVGTCPACWPAYAGLLSTLGLGFLFKTAYLLPITIAFLLLAVGALAYHARSRRGYGPVMLGSVGAAMLLGGKFALTSNPIMYGGIVMLVMASLWNAWPLGAAGMVSSACPACAPTGPAVNSPASGAPEDCHEHQTQN